MPDLQIREAVAGDIERLAATGQRLFIATYGHISGAEDMAAHVDDYFSERAVATELERDGVRYLLAIDGKAIAGFLKLRRNEIPKSVPALTALEVQQLYVSPVQAGWWVPISFARPCNMVTVFMARCAIRMLRIVESISPRFPMRRRIWSYTKPTWRRRAALTVLCGVCAVFLSLA